MGKRKPANEDPLPSRQKIGHGGFFAFGALMLGIFSGIQRSLDKHRRYDFE